MTAIKKSESKYVMSGKSHPLDENGNMTTLTGALRIRSGKRTAAAIALTRGASASIRQRDADMVLKSTQ